MTESGPRPLIDVPLIDVIVPVHGAGAVFRRCAASLIAHADAFRAVPSADACDAATPGPCPSAGARHRLVIVLDGLPDAESVRAVEELRAAAATVTATAAETATAGVSATAAVSAAAVSAAAARHEGGGFEGASDGGFELSVLTHETPLGFLRGANRAMRESARDVVLLNSDTQVTAGWLERMRAAAYSDPKIATVTPFSNNATICSLPRFLDENAIPADYTIDSFGALVTRVSRREYPRLPTGVGFCLYVKRSVLDEIGLFDEVFGLGYGEEVDLCFRAARRGYVHVLDDATFVFHEGSRSFGRSRERRMRRGERMMRERYPEYVPAISEFIERDPIAPARARVVDELRRSWAGDSASDWADEGAGCGANEPAGEPDAALHAAPHVAARVAARVAAQATHAGRRVLHVVQGWPPWANGAAEQYARALIRHQTGFVYARMTDPDRALGSAVEYFDGGVRVRLVVNNATQRNPLSRFGLRSRQIAADFESFLREVRPDVVHVHHLAGHALTLLDILARDHVPVVYQLHDWWPLCARVNLIDRDGLPCTGPRPAKCARCLPIAEEPAARPASMLFYAVRARRMRAALSKVDAFVVDSQSIADRYTAARVLPSSARMHVLPPGDPSDGVSDATASAKDIERVYEEVMRQRRL
jgi:GT2 family glycosyltransferase